MKKFIATSILVALFAAGTTLMAQNQKEEYLGLPGDNLNLYAVMKLFQESKTLEDFERDLNDEKSHINNLDLNGDNMVDYIRVIDNIDGNVHNIVLQDAINDKESQDVAVFTVQRFPNGQVQIQLTGDEELYGKNYIIEPIYGDENTGQKPNPGYTGNVRTTTVEIAAWPLVRFIFLPSYAVWHSSWYWGYYPSYWHPWHPFFWHYYYGYHYNLYHDYYGHYRRWDYHRYSRWNDFYYSHRRTYSPDVSHRIQAGNYNTTYSHPDQRKDGEAMYGKIHPAQYRRSSDNTSGNRSGAQSTKDRQPIGYRTGTTRRSTSTETNKSITNPPAGQNKETTRRSVTTVDNKSVTNPPSGQNAGTNRTSGSSKTSIKSSSNRRSKRNKSKTTIKQDGKQKEPDTEKDIHKN